MCSEHSPLCAQAHIAAAFCRDILHTDFNGDLPLTVVVSLYVLPGSDQRNPLMLRDKLAK